MMTDELKAWAERYAGIAHEVGRAMEISAAVLALIAERDEAKREHIALMNVSGALVDSGEVVPEDECLWGETVRKIVADRNEAIEGECERACERDAALARAKDAETKAAEREQEAQQLGEEVVVAVGAKMAAEAKLADSERERDEAIEGECERACERDRAIARAEAAEAKLIRVRENLEHDGFDCPACLDPSPSTPHDLTDRSCIYGPNSRTATEARLARVERERDETRASAWRQREDVTREANRAETAEARVEALEKALKQAWKALDWIGAGNANNAWAKVQAAQARAALAAGGGTKPVAGEPLS